MVHIIQLGAINLLNDNDVLKKIATSSNPFQLHQPDLYAHHESVRNLAKKTLTLLESYLPHMKKQTIWPEDILPIKENEERNLACKHKG